MTEPRLQKMMRETLDGYTRRDEWDLPPDLRIVVRMPKTPGLLIAERLPVPDVIWESAKAHRVLRVLSLITAAYGTPMELPDGAELEAAMLVVENWGMNTAGMTKAEADELLEWTRTHSIADHPRGLEQRLVIAADVHGGSYALIQSRGHTTPDAIMGANEEPNARMSGRLVDALGGFVAAAQSSWHDGRHS